MNRRTFIKRSFGSLITLVGLSGGTYFYARDIEPNLLKITEEPIHYPNIPAAFHNFKIIQFSDTHIGFHYDLDQFKELAIKINQLQPDLILFSGDLVDKPNQFYWDDRIVEILRSMNAEHGKYWIYGNHDHGGYGTEIVKDIMEAGEFILLQNESVPISKDGSYFTLAGIDDVMLGKPDLNTALQNQQENDFTILLSHEPDFADITKNYPVQVQLSGHSHGGQVRFPFIGDLYTPPYAEKYVQGKYELHQNFTLYVNSGIGTTRLPYRFLCKPELHMYELKAKR
ncbi:MULTISPECIES: metallophosphoesterase [Oceanobacillus]|uniref:Metallophosphoesterase YkuE n=1 Tax=Oceanobacillus kimchii TaxID=746691 RepID=A0ABQ5TH90_9BACI|nr:MULTISPECIES: metallophosphoesterase [Oceanobacillus]MBT2598865.1 metallophosphoesterase [Oceanobacillus sp. ISL-74]MBT2651784.1 metallophosphoesterase [Oceanobacillus sp. ISL-73]MCT1576433.1 metallophosphoesterase [Oceanobacillus kimchii]MCT2136069.1 metallophosphoesterase [Oceanobacillus kimchii]OEH54511.1 metallophosphoesterase [Oceanobacillus sp. E9]